MAGVRSKQQANGKFIGWFMDTNGKQKFFAGSRSRSDTLRIAERLEDEHRQVKLGYRPVPKKPDKHKTRPFKEVVSEYLAWGNMNGGRGGRPWDASHAEKRKRLLAWWQNALEIGTLADLDGILPRVEAVLKELKDKGLSGKTLENYRSGICALCDWCVKRSYLADDPLRESKAFDVTPLTRRRSLTVEEIKRLVTTCRPQWQLLYLTAICSGLRVNELRSLKVKNLNIQMGGLNLEAEWTKNRKAGFQPLPSSLMERLAEAERDKQADDSLLTVPTHVSRTLRYDLNRAGITRFGVGGKVDFHALRGTYINLVLESGASVKEAQDLARHSTPHLTMNVYGQSRWDKRNELAELVGQKVLGEAANSKESYAICRTKQAMGEIIPFISNELRENGKGFKSSRPDLILSGQNADRDTAQYPQSLAKSSSHDGDGCSLKDNTITQPEHSKSTTLQKKYAAFRTKIQDQGKGIPSGLESVIEAWPELPDAIRSGIVAMVRAARKKS